MATLTPQIVIITDTYLMPGTQSPFPGGEQRIYHELTNLALDLGFSCTIVQENPIPQTWTLPNGLNVFGFPRKRWWGRLPKPLWARQALNALPHAAPQAIVMASYPEHLIEITDRKTVLYQHGVNWDAKHTKDRNIVKIHKKIIPKTINIICVDTNYPNVLATHFSEKKMISFNSKLIYIPNFNSMPSQPLPNLGPEGVRFLFPRNFVVGRGIHLVAQAALELWEQGHRFHLTLCGQPLASNPQADRFFASMRPAVEAGQAAFVHRPFQEMVHEYGACHVVLVPTLFSEGTSLSCLEAFGTGRPVIATWVGGLQNLLQDRYNGRLIRPTAEDLREAMKEFIVNPRLIDELRTGALETAQRFSKEAWDSKITKWLLSLREA